MMLPPLIWKKNLRAKRISLRIDPAQRAVIITLPPGITQKAGLSFLHDHTHWISKALADLPPRAMETGFLPVEGHTISLISEPHAQRGVWMDEKGIHISGQKEHHERRLKDFLKILAQKRITESVTSYSHKMSLFPTHVTLRDTKTRWGSCTKQGHMMLSWRLLLAPSAIRDYVIVHELAHLRYFHHKPAFWTLVDLYCPQNQQGRVNAEIWLKTHGGSLLSII